MAFLNLYVILSVWEDHWDTYYGPMLVTYGENVRKEYPDISKVDKDMLDYWKNRSKECSNHILRSRYADLAVDFSKKILNKSTAVDFFRMVIDSNIRICKKCLLGPTYCKEKETSKTMNNKTNFFCDMARSHKNGVE